jgi:5'-3' exonuclease
MHPSSLLSYYPTYAILDEIVSYGNYKKLNIFMDLKNNLQSTYMEHAILNIVENSKNNKFMDSSVFSSVISFLSFHKIYGMKRGIDINFVIFFESGRSYYHTNISSKYKISRKIDDLYGLDVADREKFFEVLQANYQLVDKACNKLPGVKVVRLPNLEADFVPYYMLSRKKVPTDGSVGNVVYSNDHDLWQCAADHSYIFSKSAKVKKIIKAGTVMDHMLKRKSKIPDIFLPLSMAVIGDPGDDVDGVKGVGPARFLEIFDQLISMTGDMGKIYKKVENNQDLFDFIPPTIQNKYLNTVVNEEVKSNTVSKNLKLVSFELISRALDNPSTTEMIDKRKIIEKILEDDEVYPCESMKTALQRTGVYLEESSIDFLYL